MIAGSRSPERVPITSPSRGVNPIEVSMGAPSLTAATEHPLPRWSAMIAPRPEGVPVRPWYRAITYRYDVPWKPKRRMP